MLIIMVVINVDDIDDVDKDFGGDHYDDKTGGIELRVLT